MNTSKLRVIALFQAKPDRGKELLEFLSTKLIPATRQEAGCLRYELHQNSADPNDIAFIEEWDSEAALDAHLASAHVQAALPLVGEYLRAPVDIRRYQLIA